MNATNGKSTVVIIHGAWADGSSWKRVTRLLQSRGVKTIAAPIPLTSLSDDVRALDRALERTNGPVVLVAHAYAGAVIGSARNDLVRGLVFVSALAPDEGETVAEVLSRAPHPQAPQLAPDPHGFIWMPNSGFAVGIRVKRFDRRQYSVRHRAAPDQCSLHPGEGPPAAMEERPVLVPRCETGPYDTSEDTGVHGITHESRHTAHGHRPHSDLHGA